MPSILQTRLKTIIIMINTVLLCDGTSDFCLIELSNLIIDENFPNIAFRFSIARDLVPARSPLKSRLLRTHELYAPDLIICHRDAEGEDHAQRIQEIEKACFESNLAIPVISAVPVRMIESWLLSDPQSIRIAANNSNGKHAIDFPPANQIEKLIDPKQKLFSLLREASNLSARRMEKFDVHAARARVASHLTGIQSLRTIQSFRNFEENFRNKVEQLTPRV